MRPPPQLLRGGPESLLRSLHIQKDPKNYAYIKVGGQVKVRPRVTLCFRGFIDHEWLDL